MGATHISITQLLKSNHLPRKQKGQRIETPSAFFLRYYTTVKTHGQSVRKQACIKLADKSDMYRTWDDVEPLIERELEKVNSGADIVTGQLSIADFIEQHYLPWCQQNKSAVTANSYEKVWERYWKSRIGGIALVNLMTAQVTKILTDRAKSGLGSRTLSHMKWMLSGVYIHAIALGVVPTGGNPVPHAKWLHKTARPEKQAEYSLEAALAILHVLEPLDIRAACAVALAYFAALRPAEIRGLKWEDWRGDALDVKRSVWRNKIGETKTEGSAASVPVIEPLPTLLAKLKAFYAKEGCSTGPQAYIIQNAKGNPLSLDSLNYRFIAPTLKKEGIAWRGYYPGRRGISSLVTDTSKNALNSTGLLRHSTPITALRHYTRAQADSIRAAMEQIEEKAQGLLGKEIVQ